MKALFLFLLSSAALFAAPKGAEVVAGSANVTTTPLGAIEVMTSDRAVINWEEFSLGKGEIARFIQPGKHSAVLNRVANGVSEIHGLLQANGKVYLINPRGVLIGKDGVIETASFLATTLDCDTDAFLAGRELKFKGGSAAKVVNLGKVKALGGDIFLFAKAVVNEGSLEATGGDVGLASATEILLKPAGKQRLFIAPKGEGADLQEGGNAYQYAIQQKGVIEASHVKEEGGRIFLVAEKGTNVHSGRMVAEGGRVEMHGSQVGLLDGAEIDVSADYGGGSVLISSKGAGALATGMLEGATINADARILGDGGEVILWSDDSASLQGKVFARGGSEGGDGGFVEVSGLKAVSYQGHVNTRAPHGNTGELLIDPTNFTISTDPDIGFIFDETTGVFRGAAASANLNNTIFQMVLDDAETNIRVETSSSFSADGTISISDSFAFNTEFNLTFSAQSDITLEGGLISNGSTGNVTLTTDGSLFASNTFEGIDLAGGKLNLNAGVDISLIPQGGSPLLFSSTGDVNFSAGRNILLGDPTSSSEVLVIQSDSAVNMNAGNQLILAGGNTLASAVLVNIGGGTNTFNIGGNLLLMGGSTSETFVNIGGTDRIGDMVFTVGGSVQLTGGTANEGFAQIGLNSSSGMDTIDQGDITFNSINGDLILLGGTNGPGVSAIIGHSPIRGGSSFFAQGDISVNKVEGDIILNAQDDIAFIGFGGLEQASTSSYEGTVNVGARGTITINGGAENVPAGIGFASQGTDTVSAGIERLFVRAGAMSLNGGDGGNAYIGFYESASNAANVRIDEVVVDVRNQIVLNPGTPTSSFNGSAAIGLFASQGPLPVGTVEVNGGDIFLNGGTDATLNLSTLVSQNNDLTVRSRNLNVGRNGTTLNSALVFANGDLLTISDKNTVLGPNAEVTSQAGSVTIVVDNDHPNEPEIGQNLFQIDDGATLNALDSLRIFTARRSLNQIGTTLNGANYVPGPLFIDSDTEQWASYFFRGVGGFPFTVFYKTGLPSDIYNLYGASLSEMLQNLRVYDDLLFDAKCFLFEYDRECYFQHIHPKGMRSSFDLLPDESVEVLRQKYRNYHTKYVESF